jgi:hypothetical protein
MKKIFKYELKVTDEQIVKMPADARFYSTGLDPSGVLCLWALVTPGFSEKKVKVFVIGTGNPFPVEDEDKLDFIGRVNMGPFVWHVFVEK